MLYFDDEFNEFLPIQDINCLFECKRLKVEPVEILDRSDDEIVDTESSDDESDAINVTPNLEGTVQPKQINEEHHNNDSVVKKVYAVQPKHSSTLKNIENIDKSTVSVSSSFLSNWPSPFILQ